MTAFALSLLLLAAICHATWNLFAKRVGGGAVIIWLFCGSSVVLYAPFALGVAWMERPELGWSAALALVAAAALHIGYFHSLQRGYALGDLSLVYPLARGVGPMLTMALAVALLGERPSALALAGAVLIASGIFAISGGFAGLRHGGRGTRAAVAYGLLTACFICGYTLVDKQAVSVLRVPPLLYDWLSNAGRTLLLTPLILRRRAQVRVAWMHHRRAVLVIAVLSPLAYILVLTAMVFTPVSYVAPAREISILIGTLMGARLLAERVGPMRYIAAVAMTAGVVMLALG